MFIDNKCSRNDIFNITVNGGSTTAAFKELMQGNPDRASLKITNMFIPWDRIPTTVLCFSLRGYNQQGNCPTLLDLVRFASRPVIQPQPATAGAVMIEKQKPPQ